VPSFLLFVSVVLTVRESAMETVSWAGIASAMLIEITPPSRLERLIHELIEAVLILVKIAIRGKEVQGGRW
jgi:hypothetical protein